MSLSAISLPTVLAATLTFVSTPIVRVSERLPSEAAETPCCFQNPRYAGTCTVQPAENETCGSILAYLNNPMAEGKSYCGGTTIRGGWTEVSCEKEKGESGRDRVSPR
jgi:hypothetical protein